MSYEEVANQLGVCLNTVKAYTKRRINPLRVVRLSTRKHIVRPLDLQKFIAKAAGE